VIDLDPQGADIDPRPRRELEVLGHSPIEQDACIDVPRVNQPTGIAHAIVAVAVEGLGRGFRLAPVAGRDTGAFDAQFVFRTVRREFQADAGNRKADIRGSFEGK